MLRTIASALLAATLCAPLFVWATVATPILFGVRSPTGQTSYLFGSFHYGIGLDELPPSTVALFRSAKAHAFEIDVAHDLELMRRLPTDPGALEELVRLGGHDPSQPGDFDPSEQRTLVNLGIPPRVAKIFRDDQCQLLVARRYLFGVPLVRSLDSEFQLMSRSLGATFIELESDEIREQTRREATAAGYDNSCSVRTYLRDPAKLAAEDEFLDQFRTYYRQLTPAQVLAMPDDDDPDVRLRNEIWMKRLMPLFNATPTFVVVGFAHLAGPHGLIRRLLSAGYAVYPVP